MARSGIRYEDVKDAAETLLGRGLNPTIQRVRELLGTGSNTTISDHLKSWQQQLADAPKLVLPPAVPETVMTALDAFWKIAVQQAEAAFEKQRTVARQAVIAAEQIRDAALTAQQQAQAEAAEINRQLEAAQTISRDLADRLLVEQERRAAAETAIQAAEQRVQAAIDAIAQIRAETAARIAQFEAAIQQTRADMAYQAAEAQHRFEAERQRGEAGETRLMQLLDGVRTEQTSERQAFATERLDWKLRETGWQTRLETQQREQTDLRAALAATEERQQNFAHEIEALRPLLHQAEARYLETVREAEILRGELKAVLAERDRLQQQLEARPAPLPPNDAPAVMDVDGKSPPDHPV
jgi:chromosome segregation ATPase